VSLSNGPRVFVVLLNYRNPGDTLRCIASLRRSDNHAIHPVVVENGSGNGDSERLGAALGPAIPVLDSGANLGYAGGNNVGIRHALERDADYVWILNPDTEVEPDTLTGLLTTMALRPDAGFVGSLNLFGGSSPPIIQFAGGHIDWAGGVVAESIGRGKPLSSRPQRDPYEVDYVAGTSMLVRRRIFDEIGLLPEHYFLYFEETDFQVSAARHGWKSVLNPLARVWHYQSSAAYLPAPYYTYYYIRGRLLFAHKFSDCDDETIVAGLSGFIEGWRNRVAERAPEWLDTYTRLVEWALADGKAGVTGRRLDVDVMNVPGG
jgi:GT2 family glycosyltransferase